MAKVLFFFLFLFLYPSHIISIEQAFQDLPSSVEVLPIFSLSLSRNQIDFGIVEPGASKILGESGYFNELRCRSNYGKTWYLKAEILSGPKLLGSNFSLPLNTFKFRVISKQGLSEPKAGLQFEPLSERPKIIYISQGDENLGKEVILGFQYQFTLPPDAPAGNYVGQILFTLTDTP